jgi:hypothetical protein
MHANFVEMRSRVFVGRQAQLERCGMWCLFLLCATLSACLPAFTHSCLFVCVFCMYACMPARSSGAKGDICCERREIS